MIDESLTRDIIQALSGVPYNQAEVIMMHYGLGQEPLSLDEIARLK